jgi:hypothetical protein
VLVKLQDSLREFGAVNGMLYLVSRALDRLGGAIRLYRYILVAQPVPKGSLLGPRRGQSIEVRQVGPGDPAFAAMPLDAKVLDFRFGQDAMCFGAFQADAMVGCIWLCLGPYLEDEVRCRFSPQPAGEASWDFDIYIRPDSRTGLVFARLWDTANGFMRDRGVAWSFSRISAFKPRSLASHSRLGARAIGTATFLCAGKWQVSVSGLRPYLYLSLGPRRVPEILLAAPKDRM